MNIGVIVAAVLISLAIGAIVGVLYRKKIAESKVGNAEEEAKRIVNMAKIEAENLKKEEIIKAKEEIMANLSLMAFNCLLDIPFLGTYIILAMVGIPAIVFLLFVMTPKGKQWFNSIN